MLSHEVLTRTLQRDINYKLNTKWGEKNGRNQKGKSTNRCKSKGRAKTRPAVGKIDRRCGAKDSH